MTHPLKHWRREHGVTLEKLAQATGLSKPHLSMIENGRAPGRKSIEALAAYTGLAVSVFFQGSPASAGNAGAALAVSESCACESASLSCAPGGAFTPEAA